MHVRGNVAIPLAEIDVRASRSSGPGGQHANVTASRVEAVFDVAARSDANPDVTLPREASIAKLKATETAKRATLEGMQMMGGYGYAVEYDMERQVRTAVVTTIYGGTSEIQRDIIAKTLGL